MTDTPNLAVIDFLTHNKVRIAAGAEAIWPRIVDVDGSHSAQRLIPLNGDPGCVGARFHAVSREAPDVPLFFVENVELATGQRRTIRLDSLEGDFMGFATWELTPSGPDTIVAYDVYCRGPMLPAGQSEGELLAFAHNMMDAGLARLKVAVEG
jgi:hypothetical protein